MARKLSRDEFDRLQGMDFKDDAELDAALAGGTPEAGASETAAAAGAGYELAPGVVLPPLTLGRLLCLELIDCPLLREGAEGMTLRDMTLAVYVLARGPRALQGVAAIARRRKALDDAKGLAEKSPEFFCQWLAAQDAVAQAWAGVELAAAEFFDALGPVDLQRVGQTLVDACQDGAAGFGALPRSGAAADEKKTPGSMMNGPPA